jgi:hypothetical protein
VAGEGFDTLDALRTRIRGILNDRTLADGAFIEDTKDKAFLCDLFRQHWNPAGKIGRGIAAISTEADAGKWKYAKTRHFMIYRLDGTSTDIGAVTHCVDSIAAKAKGTSQAQLNRAGNNAAVMLACREAIAQQILDFRAAFWREHPPVTKPVCPVSGQALTRSNSDVDHASPLRFETLVQKFFSDVHPMDLGDVASHIGGYGDRDLTRVFKDTPAARELCGRFQNWHAQTAKLRVVTRDANRGLLRRGQKRTALSDRWAPEGGSRQTKLPWALAPAPSV